MSLLVDFPAVQRTATVPDRAMLLDEARALARLGEISHEQMARFEGRLQRHYDHELDRLADPAAPVEPSVPGAPDAPYAGAATVRRLVGVSVFGVGALGGAAWLLASALGNGFMPAPWGELGPAGWPVAASLLASGLLPLWRPGRAAGPGDVPRPLAGSVVQALGRLALGMAAALVVAAATLQLGHAWGTEFVAREATLDQVVVQAHERGACRLQAELVLDLQRGRICLDGRWSGSVPGAGDRVLVSGRRSALGTHIAEARPAPRRDGAGRPAW